MYTNSWGAVLRTLQLAAGSSPAALAAALGGGRDEAAVLRALAAAIEVPAKTVRFLQTLQELEGEKAVVFTQFRATLDEDRELAEDGLAGWCDELDRQDRE